jgi:SAM-dependent methyltransferase
VKLKETFEDLFAFLESVNYQWIPSIPERLVKLRREKDSFSFIDQYFGLGIPVSFSELENEGLPESIYSAISTLHPAISQSDHYYISHSHWPSTPENAENYVHFGNESLTLLRLIQPYFSLFKGKKVLDLGSGSGVLSLELGNFAAEVVGIESSTQAAQWSMATAKAHKLTQVSFLNETIGRSSLDYLIKASSWDVVVSNPPFTIPLASHSFPHRDGGHMGLELPFLFLNFAWRCLKPGGFAFFLVGNPIVRGRPLFFERLKEASKTHPWRIRNKQCLHTHFNHQLYRKERYHEQGIERVELQFLLLQKP